MPTTGIAARPAGWPRSWRRRQGCRRAPRGLTCTPSWMRHDRGRVRAGAPAHAGRVPEADLVLLAPGAADALADTVPAAPRPGVRHPGRACLPVVPASGAVSRPPRASGDEAAAPAHLPHDAVRDPPGPRPVRPPGLHPGRRPDGDPRPAPGREVDPAG